MRIAHVITRLILGGAQENVVLCCEDLRRDYGDDVLLDHRAAAGTGGQPARSGQGRGGPAGHRPRPAAGHSSLARPGQLSAHRQAAAANSTPTSSIPIAPKAASSAGPPPGACACRPSSTPCTARRFIRTKARWRGRSCAACERWAARRCHALVSVADAMTELMVGRRRGPAGEVHHDLQRHGGRAVAGVGPASRDAMRRRAGLPPERRGDRQDRAARFTSRATTM